MRPDHELTLMLRIRFHGRGGQGVKTASRILDTAAFASGFQVQDSPVYGAERRGAAVAAYVRIDSGPILERGVIDRPDLIVIGDETLLADGGAGVLVGQQAASAVFVNAPTAQLAAKLETAARLVTLDITERTLRLLGKASALSSGLAAAAARLIGEIPLEQLESAVKSELAELSLAEETIERNVALAREVFQALPAIEFRPATGERPAEQAKVVRLAYDPPLRSAPTILAPGNAAQRKTGDWRVERPAIDYERCTRCGLCFVACPDAAITLDEKGYPVIDYEHCKGCMICREQCPLEAIETEKETRSW
ncbi:MAG TPA: 2-oxoacid:acceptor oxidoreductase family protein [Pirellulales bacterium]|nr:2-oxoacid:acceptor oxidoreductase family protein [Pirellulales bacterium]